MLKKQALDLDLSLASFSNDVVEIGTHERLEESASLQDFHGVAASIGLVRFRTSNFKLGMLLFAGTTRTMQITLTCCGFQSYTLFFFSFLIQKKKSYFF